MSFPGKNEYSGTNCSLIVSEDSQDCFCQLCQRVCSKRKDEGEDKIARTERESERNGKLFGAAETSGELAEWHRLQRNNLNKLSLSYWKGWPFYHKVSSWQEHQSRFCSEKEQSYQSRSLEQCNASKATLRIAMERWR